MDLNDLSKNPEQIKNLITLLTALLPKDDQAIEEDEQDNGSVIKSKKARQNKKKFVNKFSTMPEAQMHKEDIAIDKLLQVHPPTARQRPANMIDVRCRVCGKEETVPNSLATESRGRYKCNACSTNAG
jgi:hypothetical protein